MSERRPFYFPPDYVDIAKQSGIADIAEQISKRKGQTRNGENVHDAYSACSMGVSVEEDVTVEIRDFTKSEVFKNLSNEEQAWAIEASHVVGDGEWVVVAAEMSHKDRLFPVTGFAGRMKATQIDRLTLTGAGAYEYENIQEGFFNSHQEHGFKTKLEFMQFAGAWLCSQSVGAFSLNKPEVTLPDHDRAGMDRKIELGGDVHGDFRMRQMLVPSRGAINPLGEQVPYAPYAQTAAVAGYHSIEKSLMLAACAYVLDNEHLSQREKERLFEIHLTENMPDEKPEIGASLYGDFGDDDFGLPVQDELDFMRLSGVDGDNYVASIITPGNEENLLIAKKNDRGNLEIKNTYSKNGIELDAIGVASLFDLFKRVGGAESRTSKSSILHAIACAQQELVNGTEPGHIVYRGFDADKA